MGFLAVKKFQWIEPKTYREEQDRASAAFWRRLWWLRPACVLGFSLPVALIGWAKKTFLQEDSLAGSLVGFALLLGISMFLFYGMPSLIRRLPASVTVYSKGIMKMGDQYIFPFKGMTGYLWLQTPNYYVLRISTLRGRVLSYGVPDATTRDKIDAVLEQQSVPRSGV